MSSLDELVDWDEISQKAKQRAKARALLVYTQENKKRVLAEEMHKVSSEHSSCAAQEREAYRSQSYQEYLDNLYRATEDFESLDFELKMLIERIGIWRTKQSTKRAAMQAGG